MKFFELPMIFSLCIISCLSLRVEINSVDLKQMKGRAATVLASLIYVDAKTDRECPFIF